MNNEDKKIIFCKHCEYHEFELYERIFSNGLKHIQAICSHCKTHLQFIPQSDQSELTQVGDIPIQFGKHKGCKLKDLPSDYVKWLLNQDTTKEKLKNQLKAIFENK